MSLEAGVNGDQRARQVLAEIFADMMDVQDRAGNLPCPVAIPVISGILFAALSSQSITLFCRQYPHVIRAMIRFLMAPRTLEERRALYAITERECSCARDNYGGNQWVRDIHAELSTNPRFHAALAAAEGVPPLQRLLRVCSLTLAQIVEMTFEKVPIKRFVEQAGRNSRYDGRQPWPRDRQDVFPFGVAESCNALCDWLELHPRPEMEILRLLHTSWATVLQRAFPGLLVNTIVPRAVIPVLGARLAELDELRGPARGRAREALVDIAAVALGPLQMLDEMEYRPIRAATGGDLRALAPLPDLCFSAFEKLSAPADPPIKDALRARMLLIGMSTRIHDLVECTPIAELSAESRVQAETENNAVYQLTAYGRFIRAPVVCANPGCNHTHFSVGRRLFKCTGCEHAFYCSTTCQRASWRHASTPHRDVCMELRCAMDVLVDTLEGFQHTPEFTARDKACRDAQILMEHDVLEPIIRHLEASYAGHQSAD